MTPRSCRRIVFELGDGHAVQKSAVRTSAMVGPTALTWARFIRRSSSSSEHLGLQIVEAARLLEVFGLEPADEQVERCAASLPPMLRHCMSGAISCQEHGLGRRVELVQAGPGCLSVSTSFHFSRTAMVSPGRSAMSLAIRSMAVSKASGLACWRAVSASLIAGLEEQLRQRLGLLGLGGLVALVEELEVLPVVEDQEVRLVLARAEQVFAEPGAAADHLPELDVGVDRLGEDQVDDLGHVDAGVEHVHRDGDGQVGVACPRP